MKGQEEGSQPLAPDQAACLGGLLLEVSLAGESAASSRALEPCAGALGVTTSSPHDNPARDMALISSSQMRKLGPREAKQLAQNHSSINHKGVALGANSPVVSEWASPST